MKSKGIKPKHASGRLIFFSNLRVIVYILAIFIFRLRESYRKILSRFF